MVRDRRGNVFWVFVFLGVIFGVYREYQEVKQSTQAQVKVQDDYYQSQYSMCEEFLLKNFISEDGWVIDQISQEESVIIPYEKDIESQILYLNYLLYGESESVFEGVLEVMLEDMKSSKDFIALTTEPVMEGKEEVDLETNLQIIEILHKAYKKWGNVRYKEMIYNIEEGVYTQYFLELEKEYEKLEVASLNLYAMLAVAEYDGEWEEVYLNSKHIVEGAYISDEFPFYNMYYDVELGTYENEEVVCMLSVLETVLHVAEVGALNEETVEWLKEHLKSDGIYASYNPESVEVEEQEEEIEIYAMIARIAKNINDIELYVLAIEKMLQFQEVSEDSFARGAFLKGNYKINARDNLQALLAF